MNKNDINLRAICDYKIVSVGLNKYGRMAKRKAIKCKKKIIFYTLRVLESQHTTSPLAKSPHIGDRKREYKAILEENLLNSRTMRRFVFL